MSGATPRARGRPSGGGQLVGNQRTTPACAGTTQRGIVCHVRPPNYPPRARGRRRYARDRLAGTGTTPACAGTTHSRRSSVSRSRNYPRVRGDDRCPRSGHSTQRELPPRARGRLWIGPPQVSHRGTTPACAGTTSGWSRPGRPGPNYPRVRGDDSGSGRRRSRIVELPPRARGRRRVGRGLDAQDRTTPACAGTTGSPRCGSAAPWNYPRVRGDDQVLQFIDQWIRELPPRARGRHPDHRAGERRGGTTPACARTTLTTSPTPCTRKTYPRVRGDDGHPGWRRRRLHDLPPRARGRHLLTSDVGGEAGP